LARRAGATVGLTQNATISPAQRHRYACTQKSPKLQAKNKAQTTRVLSAKNEARKRPLQELLLPQKNTEIVAPQQIRQRLSGD
jgi:hypothetical protein